MRPRRASDASRCFPAAEVSLEAFETVSATSWAEPDITRPLERTRRCRAGRSSRRRRGWNVDTRESGFPCLQDSAARVAQRGPSVFLSLAGLRWRRNSCSDRRQSRRRTPRRSLVKTYRFEPVPSASTRRLEPQRLLVLWGVLHALGTSHRTRSAPRPCPWATIPWRRMTRRRTVRIVFGIAGRCHVPFGCPEALVACEGILASTAATRTHESQRVFWHRKYTLRRM